MKRLVVVLLIVVLLWPCELLADGAGIASAVSPDMLGDVRLPVPVVLERPTGDPFAIPGYAIKKAPSYFESDDARLSRARELNGRDFKSRATGARASVRSGLSAGSVGQRVLLAVGTGTVSGLLQGRSAGESLAAVRDEVATAEFLVGRVGGAVLGASLASALPVPALGGILGRAVAPLPALAAALIFGGIGAEVVGAWKTGHVDLAGILRNFDYTGVLAQALGSSLCMGLAATLPVGSVGVVLAGIVGAFAGEWAMAAFRDFTGRTVETVRASVSSSLAAATAESAEDGGEAAAPMTEKARELYRGLVVSLKEGRRNRSEKLFESYRAVR